MTDTTFDSHFEEFIRHKKYLAGVTSKTIQSYRDAWKAFQRYQGQVSRSGARNFVYVASEAGLSVGAIRSYARSINSFLAWLYAEEIIREKFTVPLPKAPRKVITTYKPDDISRILAFPPETQTDYRLSVLLALLVDTGIRINEALTLTRGHVDYDGLLLRIQGKGQKERLVPISATMRALLYRYSLTHSHALLFSTSKGKPLRYDNLRRDFVALLVRAGVSKSEGCFHSFRRFCARSYLRNGGSIRYLQLMLGHADIQTTTRYLDHDVEGMSAEHSRLSPLERLKR